MINRLILWLSLAGMILTIHLWVQQARGFDQGCLGVAKPVFVEDGGCAEVSASPASHLFGVSNVAWGYAFYFGLALLSLGKIVCSGRAARCTHALGELATTGAFLYSGYLVYHMGFVGEAWCVLCLISATLVSALFALHVWLRARGGFQPVAAAERSHELALAAGAGFAACGVLVGVLVFVDRLGTRPLDQGSTGRELERIVGEALPAYIDPARLREMRACRFDTSAPRLPAGMFTGPATPFIGKADGPEVVIFYDPNCPHCKQYHPTFLRMVEQFKDRARFTILTRVLWTESEPQAAALKLAEGSGKYFELWQAMFDRQPGPRRGMSVSQIEEAYREVQIDAKDLERRLIEARPAVQKVREAVKRAGVGAVPAIYIDGRRVWRSNRSADCVGKLIDRRDARAGQALE